MRDFHSIILLIKEYLATKSKGKILDKDIADALEISQANFATMKRRNSTPYEQILLFCHREKMACEKIFFKEGYILD